MSSWTGSCRECRYKAAREKRAANLDHYRTEGCRRYAADPERHRKHARVFAERNPGKIKEKSKRYWENNRELETVKAKVWRKANPDRVKQKSRVVNAAFRKRHHERLAPIK